MNTARNFVGAHKPAAALVALALAFVLYQFGGGVISGVRGAISNAHVAQTEAQAREAQGQAVIAIVEADAAAVGRKVEDGVRERTIKPEIERTSLVVKHTRARTREAQTNYESAQNPSRVVATDDALLYARNCADYARLYPGRKRAGCRH